MDNQRLFAWALFGLMALMTWQAWQDDYGPKPAATQSPAAAAPAQPNAQPGDDLPIIGDVPGVEATTVTDETAPSATEQQQFVRVVTDVLELEINPEGGDIVSARLPKYPVAKDRPDEPITLLDYATNDFAVFRSGLTTRDKTREPNHRATFTAAATDYELGPGEQTLVVPLQWTSGDGLTVTKQFTFTRGQYRVDLDMQVSNQTGSAWDAAPYARIVHMTEAADRSMFDVESYSFKGPVVYDGEKYEKHSIGDLQDRSIEIDAVQGGWVAAIEHHFLSAIIPPADASNRYQIGLSGSTFVAGTVGAPVTVAAGQETSLPITLFVGPKLQDQLEQISPRLPLTVDYGILTLLSDPLFWLLSTVFGFVGNWGWSIIIVTILIKLVFYKLTEKSGRSIAKMRRLQPRLKAIQERYKDDRQKLSQAMMDLYKREKVNPAAGCLPILIQMPFFLAFYWVLLESVEMRQAPFLLWIQDLSSRDPFFILPLLMGAAMLAQQQLNPAPTDPVQAKVMKVLPIVFTAFFAFFPAGLVLYWFTNTLLGVAQQWQINRVVEAEERSAKD
ncbi:MAG: membrane protein insertase YidC [Pseudomonadota bacterium]